MVLITSDNFVNCGNTTREFPSPCGDYGSYLYVCMSFYWFSPSGFRPLAGIMVLIINRKIPFLSARTITVSVPLRGLWFLSLHRTHVKGEIIMMSFRPLAGIMVLIDFAEKMETVGLIVSVPLRGLWFLSAELKSLIEKSI